MDVGIAIGVIGLVWTGIVAWVFYRLAERKSATRHREGTSADSLREQARQKEMEQQAHFQRTQIDFRRRKSARDKFEKRKYYWDASVENGGRTLNIWNGSGYTYTSVEVMIYDQNSPDGAQLVSSEFWSGFSSIRVFRNGEDNSFDEVESIVVKATNQETGRGMSVEIPLDPTETMPDYRAA